MDRGTVRWFDAVKGIGFVARDRDGKAVPVESAGNKCSAVDEWPAPPKARKSRQRKKSSEA
ncbi:cold-shock protein [Pseudomonas antarctica]|uniref:cold-shock protein n=1 Tax=Pseudomonas antarctica TaxID=219572 RepID=UPI0039C3C2DF